MKSSIAFAFAVLLAAGVAAPSIAQAANARHPHRNVNHRIDRGNSTGDAETARLNQNQIDIHRNNPPQ